MMRCLGCKAWKDGKCLVGVKPYQLKREKDGFGCAYNTRTVEKLMRQNRKTNADRIRAMTDKELSVFLGSIVHDYGQGTAEIEGAGYVIDDWLDWLREEAAP